MKLFMFGSRNGGAKVDLPKQEEEVEVVELTIPNGFVALINKETHL
ncbi:MAG: hypothetical protein EZS26_003959 [Candidatus Ordinivivax streblomastigis]|uniref:Uncharacterized protein n=1 Tax=Candidatus Ordinivivax streblomastigis TaxID=2540710 RepID=A0A5M8NXT1_9BACT|nr:MAG: hypothetical protein EZS26_003959 [Candidatus Ordinivivax streblomastigis]